MMKPSALNEYDPYLITGSQGKIVLSESMFQAAVKAGIIDEKTGDPKVSRSMGNTDMSIEANTKDGSRNAFLYQLGVYNQADASTINAIMALGKDGYTDSGVGGEIIDKTLANSFTTNAFINYLKEATYTSDDGTHKKGDPLYAINLKDIFSTAGLNLTTTTSLKNDKDIAVTKNGQPITDPKELEEITLGDIIDGNYAIAAKVDAGVMENDVATAILDAMATALGKGSSGSVSGLNVDDEANDALNNAWEFTKALLNSTQTSSSNGAIISSSVNNAISKSEEVNNIVQGTNGVTAVNVSNMLKSYLTYFAISMVGYEYGVSVDAGSSANSSYITDDVSYNFVVKNDNAMTEQDALNADFYNMLYNQLCMNGACTDKMKRQQVTDPDYLNNALKNGQLFISSLNNDGYFYQGHYTLNGHVAEVTDDDAVAQAEAEYNVKKSQLNTKEQSLEVKMKNIDTELSALTTEYDTVKNLISKNVEKVFTMFST